MDVSVIIPTYNRARFLAQALDSVIDQTATARIEIVVIDDGSTDDTAQVMEPYLQQYHDQLTGRVIIQYLRQDKQGVVAARNAGLAKSRAPLVAFLDSDDYWAPQKLERQLTALRSDPDIGLVHTSFRYVDDQGQFRDEGPQRLDNPCIGWCVAKLLEEDLVIFSSVLMRRSVIDAAAAAEPHKLPFDPRWTNAQDYDLLLRAARLSRFVYIPEPLTFYRLHASHGAMGNLPRAFGFHARVQMDFASRFAHELHLPENAGKKAAADFLFGRAESMFWQRQLDTAKALCDTAQELGVADERFANLQKRAALPNWLYAAKDSVDRLLKR